MQERCIKFIGVVTAISALFSLLYQGHWESIYLLFTAIFKEGNPFSGVPKIVIALGVVLDAAVAGKLISSVGLFLLASWGKAVCIIVISMDTALRLYGVISAQMGKSIDEGTSSEIVEHTEIITISMIPNYIIILIGIASVVLLVCCSRNRGTQGHPECADLSGRK